MNASPAPMPRPITQNADIRYLGKLLGDVIRAYGGDRLFEQIESIRASSVDRYRGVADASALGRGLEALNPDDTLAFVRAFMLFSMLANLAEDRAGRAERIRRGRRERASTDSARKGVGAERGRKAAGSRADRAGAHRASDRSDAQEHDRPPQSHRRADAPAGHWAAPKRSAAMPWNRRSCGRSALLWQTRPLRRERLYVADEVGDRAHLPARRVPACAAASVCALGAAAAASADEFPAHWAAGSAATATAIPTSRRTPCGSRWAARPARCSKAISISCMRWARSCRSPPSWRRRRDEVENARGGQRRHARRPQG